MSSNLEFRPGEFYFVKTGPLKGRVGRGASDNGQPSAKLAIPEVEELISFHGNMGSVRRATQAEVDQFLKRHGNHFDPSKWRG